MVADVLDVWGCERAALVGAVSVLREKARMVVSPPGVGGEPFPFHGELFLLKAEEFGWDRVEGEGVPRWSAAVVLRSSGHRLSVAKTRACPARTVELRAGDILMIDATVCHRVTRRASMADTAGDPAVACAILPGYNRRPSRDTVERDFLRFCGG